MGIQGEALERSGTLQSAAAATGDGTPFDCKGLAILGLQVVGTFVGTITWEGTVDGTNWVAMDVLDRADTSMDTTETGVGLFLANVVGLSQFRARVSAWTSGAITVTCRGSTVGLGVAPLA